ncbi:UNVERIFIED_CONTAM: hypothetical protein PYX00_007334 [Menopon gallinae]|uniref:Janus kinase and microtubule-interacting protein C-terminal domain-containing protein n=1 Tax=Menopon gallinae TaxID=328185 RepID=A0AAW2HIP1_9NEOP
MSTKSSSPSRMSLQTTQTMSLAKTLHVQDQIIEQLRTDHAALREALEVERNNLRDCRFTSDRELKALQRENIQISKLAKQQEMKVEELEKALAYTKEALAAEQKNLKSLEKEHILTVKELKLKNTKECEKSNKQEMLIDQLKSEVEDLKEALESERNATNLLIREHNAEVKMLREEVRTKSTEAYRELKERAIRERDEYREMQEEAEKTYKVLEKDFRDALAAKDEELRKVKMEARLIQKELEDQLRASLKEPTPHLSSSSVTSHDFLSNEKVKRLKNEVAILREQNRKLLNELELLTEEDRMKGIKKDHYFLPFSFQLQTDDNRQVNDTVKIDNQMEVIFNGDKSSRTEVNRLLAEIRGKNRTILKLERELSTAKQTLEKVHRLHDEDVDRLKRRFCEMAAKRPKPKLPMKLAKPCETRSSTHVRDMVRRLQERHQAENEPVVRPRKPAPEEGTQPSRTLEELKSLDQDIERLRKQIEERDKVISALREAAEAKDKKLDQLMTEYTKLQVERVEPECRASMNGDARVQERNLTAFSTSPSPPLCNGELCWTDGFVNKNYHEPVYAQLLNDHTALQKIYNELREKLESKKEDGDARKQETYENGINLIMAEQIRILKEREAQLMSEAEELREQNDLMEFRILELEECRKEEMINEHKHRNEKNIWPERDLEDISDSGVMSLPTSEDLTSDSELGDTIKNYLQTDSAIVPTLFPQIQICNDQSGADFKPKKIVRNAECLQESGIFEDSDVTESADSPTKHTKACQTESILDKAILDIIDSSCDLILSKNKSYLAERQKPAKSDDLTTEISKLSEIQKRIQEKSSESPKSQPQQKHKCPHSNSLHFYEERLRQLEDKLKIYESSGDTKDVLLKKRLEKEIELSHKVKELTEKVSSLEIIKRQIEEERCEFEEAENDSRFQCQRLEVKVQELMEKNSELELEIERQKMMMAGDSNRRKRSKDKTSDVDGSLSMTDATMPAIIAWNMFCLNQTKEELSEHLQSEALLLDEKDPIEYCKAIAYPDTEVFQKLEELISDQKKLRMEYEKAEEEAKQRELDLKRKIEELEGKSMRDREVLDEMTTYLKGLKGQDLTSNSSDSVPSTVDFEMFEEFKRLADNEMKMRRKIDTLERKEQAYLQTLQQADEIWAGMEAEYKKKLAEAEDKVKELEQKKLEETTSKSTAVVQIPSSTTLVEAPSSENNQAKGQVDGLAEAELDAKVKALEEENASLKNLIKFLSDELPLEKSKCEALAIELEVRMEQYVQDKMTIEQLGNDLEERTKNMDKVETALREQNRVSELVTALHNARLRSHGGSTSSMQATDPRLNDSPGSMSSLCDLPRDSSLLTVKRAKFEGVPEESTDGSELECLTTLTVPDGITDQQTLIERPDDPILTADASVSARTESEAST